MRAAIYQWLTADPVLLAAVPLERWIARSAITDDEEVPFVAIAMPATVEEPFSRNSSVRPCEIYVYDAPGSYVFIDEMLEKIADRMLAVQHFTHGGYRLTTAEDVGRSDDLQDDLIPANLKSASFRVIGGRVA